MSPDLLKIAQGIMLLENGFITGAEHHAAMELRVRMYGYGLALGGGAFPTLKEIEMREVFEATIPLDMVP